MAGGRRFLKMFNFFKKQSFGLDISDHSIEVICLEGFAKEAKLLAMGRRILKPGVVNGGKILERRRLEAILLELIKKPQFGEIKKNEVIFSLPESRVFILPFKIKGNLRNKEIKKEAESQALHNFPLPPEDLYCSLSLKKDDALLVAVPKNIVEDYLEVFENIKIRPLALEIESLSLGRALIEEKEGKILIVDIGSEATNFSVFDKRKLNVSITIEMAGRQFSEDLAKELKIPFEEAEILKEKIGLDPEKDSGRVFMVLQREIQQIVAEIRRIDDYVFKKEGISFGNVILSGGSATLPNLAKYLSENIERPVSIGDPWTKIEIDILKGKGYYENALKINPSLYSGAIGSALRGLERNPVSCEINLLPERDIFR